MVWCHKRQIIFIHIPKTGGTSIEMKLKLRGKNNGYGVVNNIARQHYRWHQYIQHLGIQRFNKYYKFAICRHPYSRFLSEYYWCEIPGVGYRHGQNFSNFLDYVEKIVKSEQFQLTKYHDHFIPQWRFVFDDRGRSKINKVFRFESFNEIDNFLEEKYGVIGNEHQKKNNNKKYVLSLSDRKRIYTMYRRDFELFEYANDLE